MARMTTLELIEKHGIGYNCLSDAYELGRADAIEEMFSKIEDGFTCTDCILDETDACVRGAGRAVDDVPCDFFLREGEE